MTDLKSIAILGGCGHVGLPLGLVLAHSGHRVSLIDADRNRARAVVAGTMPFLDRGADVILRRVLASKDLEVKEDLTEVGEHDVVVVTIGTPVDQYLDPMIGAFDRAIGDLLDRMRPGQLLVLRSTVFPGVTDRLWKRITDRGLQVDLAYCPERIAQGHGIEELVRLPQLVSGSTPSAVARATALFESTGARIIPLSTVEAELAKLFANAYRYINFAISNQFLMIAMQFGANFARIHAAVTADYPRMTGFAISGFAGGPCLLKDTMQLAAFNHNAFPLGHAAMLVNEGLPSYVVAHLKARRDLERDTVGILGMAFKADSDDPRDSLAYKLRKVLALECKEVLCTDPFIHDHTFQPLDRVLALADVLVVGAPHEAYRHLVTEKPIIDVFYSINRHGL